MLGYQDMLEDAFGAEAKMGGILFAQLFKNDKMISEVTREDIDKYSHQAINYERRIKEISLLFRGSIYFGLVSGPFNPLGYYDKLKMAETDTFFLVEPDDRYIVSVVHPEGISPLSYAKKAKEIEGKIRSTKMQ